jgi:type II secretory pathway component GspD/PulD (secretin)
VHTFYLRNATQQNDANEIYTALRQMLPPDAKSFFVPNQMAIELCALPDQIALAQKMLNDLDRPKKNYRLTYTVTEMDGAKPIGTQRFSMVVTPGQQATLKQGSRVPVVTGSFTAATANQEKQMTYVDVGMNFDATIDTTSEGIRLRTTVEQSSVAEGKGIGPENPVIRQAQFRGTSYLAPARPLKVGTFDIPDTTRHLDIEVSMEPLQ